MKSFINKLNKAKKRLRATCKSKTGSTLLMVVMTMSILIIMGSSLLMLSFNTNISTLFASNAQKAELSVQSVAEALKANNGTKLLQIIEANSSQLTQGGDILSVQVTSQFNGTTTVNIEAEAPVAGTINGFIITINSKVGNSVDSVKFKANLISNAVNDVITIISSATGTTGGSTNYSFPTAQVNGDIKLNGNYLLALSSLNGDNKPLNNGTVYGDVYCNGSLVLGAKNDDIDVATLVKKYDPYEEDAAGDYVYVNGAYVAYETAKHANMKRFKKLNEKRGGNVYVNGDLIINSCYIEGNVYVSGSIFFNGITKSSAVINGDIFCSGDFIVQNEAIPRFFSTAVDNCYQLLTTYGGVSITDNFTFPTASEYAFAKSIDSVTKTDTATTLTYRDGTTQSFSSNDAGHLLYEYCTANNLVDGDWRNWTTTYDKETEIHRLAKVVDGTTTKFVLTIFADRLHYGQKAGGRLVEYVPYCLNKDGAVINLVKSTVGFEAVSKKTVSQNDWINKRSRLPVTVYNKNNLNTPLAAWTSLQVNGNSYVLGNATIQTNSTINLAGKDFFVNGNLACLGVEKSVNSSYQSEDRRQSGSTVKLQYTAVKGNTTSDYTLQVVARDETDTGYFYFSCKTQLYGNVKVGGTIDYDKIDAELLPDLPYYVDAIGYALDKHIWAGEHAEAGYYKITQNTDGSVSAKWSGGKGTAGNYYYGIKALGTKPAENKTQEALATECTRVQLSYTSTTYITKSADDISMKNTGLVTSGVVVVQTELAAKTVTDMFRASVLANQSNYLQPLEKKESTKYAADVFAEMGRWPTTGTGSMSVSQTADPASIVNKLNDRDGYNFTGISVTSIGFATTLQAAINCAVDGEQLGLKTRFTSEADFKAAFASYSQLGIPEEGDARRKDAGDKLRADWKNGAAGVYEKYVGYTYTDSTGAKRYYLARDVYVDGTCMRFGEDVYAGSVRVEHLILDVTAGDVNFYFRPQGTVSKYKGFEWGDGRINIYNSLLFECSCLETADFNTTPLSRENAHVGYMYLVPNYKRGTAILGNNDQFYTKDDSGKISGPSELVLDMVTAEQVAGSTVNYLSAKNVTYTYYSNSDWSNAEHKTALIVGQETGREEGAGVRYENETFLFIISEGPCKVWTGVNCEFSGVLYAPHKESEFVIGHENSTATGESSNWSGYSCGAIVAGSIKFDTGHNANAKNNQAQYTSLVNLDKYLQEKLQTSLQDQTIESGSETSKYFQFGEYE